MSDRGSYAGAVREGMRGLARPLFRLHVAWTALGLILLTPLVGALTRLLLGIYGDSAVADQDIALFALTPLGLGSILLVSSITVAIVGLEIASMMRVVAGAAHDRPVGVLGALRFAGAHAHRVILLALRLLVRVLLLAAPFLLAGAGVAWLLLKDHDINYYLSQRPPAFWVAGGVVGALLLALALLLVGKLIGWSLALPLVLFTKAGSRQALLESEGITSGKRIHILRVFVVWALVALGFTALLIGAIHALGSWLLPETGGSLTRTALVLGFLTLLFGLGNLLITGFNAALFSILDFALFERHGPGVASGALGAAADTESTRGWGWTGTRLLLALVVTALLSVAAGGWMLRGVRVQDDVEIIAHRGAAGAAPENTMASMRRAIADATDWIELDVQETRDGHVVVIHDSDFMKLAGVDLKVWDASFEEARAIDVGSWFAPDFAAERVPTLQEVLELARGRTGVVIELKYYGHDQDLEQRVVDIVEATGMEDSIQMMSLEYEGIQRVRALRPTWKAGLLAAKALGDLTTREADFLAVNAGMATPGFIRRAQRRGKKVYVWTVNDAVTMSRMMSLGVDGIITDEPALARRVLRERAGMSAVERLLVHAAVLFDVDLPSTAGRDDVPR